MMGDWQAFLSSRKAKTKQLGFEKVSVSLIVKDCAMYLIKEKREKQKKSSNTQEMKTAQSFYNGHVGESGDSLLRKVDLFHSQKYLV